MITFHYTRGDFLVADIASGTSSFFCMLRNASQELLRFTRLLHPVGHFGLKMLWGQFVPMDVNVVYITVCLPYYVMAHCAKTAVIRSCPLLRQHSV